MIFQNTFEKIFYDALRIRLVEEKIIELFPDDKIQSPVHLSIGQEPIAVGICNNLKQEDYLFSTYRSHAYYLAKGGDLKTMFAELYGKSTGNCCGKAGSMHLTAPEVNLMGTSALVASTIPHAVGAALAAKLLNKEHIIVTVFGDGATEEGVYHESLNFAGLHQLPILFICEDNGLASYTKKEKRQDYSLIEQASLYSITTWELYEGYDLDKVDIIAKLAIEAVRSNRKPHFIWFNTYRYKEHVGISEDHNLSIRDTTEYNLWKSHDPLIQNTELINKFSSIIKEEIEEAVEFAENSPYPKLYDLYMGVI